MTYFAPCFVCGSDEDTCGHRENDLVIWWRTMQPSDVPMPPTRIFLPSHAESPVGRMAAVLSGKKYEPEDNAKDPPKLARERMPWPSEGMTPDIALARKASA